MITFSFRPRRRSTLPLIAASVSTRVVSWKDAADSHDVVFRAALMRPSSTVCAVAGSPPLRPRGGPPPLRQRPRVALLVLPLRDDLAGEQAGVARRVDADLPHHL